MKGRSTSIFLPVSNYYYTLCFALVTDITVWYIDILASLNRFQTVCALLPPEDDVDKLFVVFFCLFELTFELVELLFQLFGLLLQFGSRR